MYKTFSHVLKSSNLSKSLKFDLLEAKHRYIQDKDKDTYLSTISYLLRYYPQYLSLAIEDAGQLFSTYV